jgi:hypothetical protein
MPAAPPQKRASGTQQPKARPTLRWRPWRVKGMPILREILPFAAEMPNALFQEKEKPNFLPTPSPLLF